MGAGQPASLANLRAASERCRAIMPAIAQAVDSAVSEVEEAIFGRERWFDLDDDQPDPTDRLVADQLLRDMRPMKSGVSETVLLGALYGTLIGKIVRSEARDGSIRQDLIAIDPIEFAIDPSATTVEEAHGVAHVFHLPKAVVLERQREGIYAQIDPGSAPQERNYRDRPEDLVSDTDTDHVRIVEYHGLVPSKMMPDPPPGEKLRYEDDRPVEAIVTIGNDNVLLRADVNPFPSGQRAFVATQWDTVPGSFWGRGVVEMGYWPQKVLDAEIRSRVDALAYSVTPMMGVNAQMVPRNADFQVRPGRNLFFNGPPSEAAAPFQFPPPDPQTYTQSQEMARYIEMATGQLQAATPFDANGRNETASGMSMILGAGIRRTRRTMANLERKFLQPLIRRTLEAFQVLDDQRYPVTAGNFRVYGTLGMMAREFEQMQLTQLLNSLPPGAPQLMVLRSIVDNMSLVGREGMIQVLDQLLQAALQPQEPPPDLGGMARIMSARLREVELQQQAEFQRADLEIRRAELQQKSQTGQQSHEREVMRLSIDAERAEAEETTKATQGILNLAKAEAEELGSQLQQYIATLKQVETPKEGAVNGGAPGVDLSGMQAMLEQAMAKLEELENRDPELSGEDIAPIQIERDGENMVTRINGRAVTRDERGFIRSIQ